MTTKIKIGDQWVGQDEPTYIIAEAGSNHNGDLSEAKKLVDAAASAGCDVIKFQVFAADTLLTRQEPAFPVIKENELPREWIPELARYASERDIIFSASPFDHDAVDQLLEVGVPFLKWASPEIHDIPLLKYAASKGIPLIISTGMCDLTDIHHAVEAARSAGNEDMVLLHCVSSYPAETKNINLRMMDSIANAFKLPVGLSDHTTSIIPPAAAVARGACVVEKHFTISRHSDGPDHFFAVEPDELTQMVTAIREVEVALGSNIKNPVAGVENTEVKFKYLVAAKEIPSGTTITESMLTVKRGRHGIIPIHLDFVLGRQTVRNIHEDEIITWDSI